MFGQQQCTGKIDSTLLIFFRDEMIFQGCSPRETKLKFYFVYIRCAEVTDSINMITALKRPKNDIHKELFATRVKRDHDDFIKLKSWFESHNPFTAGESLVALHNGLSDTKGTVTCDKAEEIGSSIPTQITGKSFASCTFKRKNQIVTLQSLYSSVRIADEAVTIDPLTLFLRLVVMIERRPNDEITKYFEYELSPYPMSLFKDGCMRPAQKSKLKAYLLTSVQTIDEELQAIRVSDGGALLWCCNWKRNETFQTIVERYAAFLKFLKVNTVVSDGYSLSTKDATHRKRSGKVSSVIEFKDSNICPTDRDTLLSNYQNKEGFVKLLATSLKTFGFQVVECPSDADTTIVKVAIQMARVQDVIVYSDDTDVLSLLVHHCYQTSNLSNVYIMNMTRKSDQRRKCYLVTDVIDKASQTCQSIQTY